jgi:hypothetical protein
MTRIRFAVWSVPGFLGALVLCVAVAVTPALSADTLVPEKQAAPGRAAVIVRPGV